MVIFNDTYFTTATILNWKHLLTNDGYKDFIVDSLKFTVDQNRALIFGLVIMPNHFHIIWQIKEGFTLERVKQSLLKYTAQRIKFDLLKQNIALLEEYRVDAGDRTFQIWERNALSIELYNQSILEQKLNYIHENPIKEKWSLAEKPELYKYSSAGFYETGVDPFGYLTHYLWDN